MDFPQRVDAESVRELLRLLRARGGRTFGAPTDSDADGDGAGGSNADVSLRAVHEVAWEHIHGGPWKDVHVAWRDAYALTCLAMATTAIAASNPTAYPAAPATPAAAVSAATATATTTTTPLLLNLPAVTTTATPTLPTPARPTTAVTATTTSSATAHTSSGTSKHFLASLRLLDLGLMLGGNMFRAAINVAVREIEARRFLQRYMLPGVPVLLQGVIAHWPALKRWADWDYLKRVAGARTVPVEMGSSYLAEGWTQELMTLGDFIDRHVLTVARCCRDAPRQAGGRRGRRGTSADPHLAEERWRERQGEGQGKGQGERQGEAKTEAQRQGEGEKQKKEGLREQEQLGGEEQEGEEQMGEEQEGEEQEGEEQEGEEQEGEEQEGEEQEGEEKEGEEEKGGEERGDERIGYLAQHMLFEQIPILRADIDIPPYCWLRAPAPHSQSHEDDRDDTGGSTEGSRKEEDEKVGRKEEGEEKEGEEGEDPVVNAWFGPAGTLTPLHHDPCHNLFAQVVGCKYVRVYSSREDHLLYAHTEKMLSNSSQVDVDAVDGCAFPLFPLAPFWDVLLAPGDLLYIPPRYWHYVKATQPSCSVSFWWKPSKASHPSN
ncbi:hypothetical protein CLOM_g13200 [Closterium sp. NIES-68]|nr:hypothetical protein CLOM_g13200 [Closterium sp. NIES-68]